MVKKDIERNILYVIKGYEPIKAHRKEFPIKDFHYLTPEGGLLPQDVTFKIRHTPDYFNGKLEQTGEGCYTVSTDRWVQGVAPGQFCVVYDKDFHRCYGSGEITINPMEG